MKNKKYKISIIGTGNVATHLAKAFMKSGNEIVCVYGRSKENAKQLSEAVNSTFTTDISDVSLDVDLIIVAIIDDAIENVIKNITTDNTLIVHSSGTLAMDVFKNLSTNYGVFYPLQTFSKNKEVVFTEIPICIEANNDKNLNTLKKIGKSISNDIRKINSEQRKIIHIAAVFACNFTNHLYSIADEILENNGISFDIMKPLIRETSKKIESNKPIDVQTGPAKRKDFEIINNHLNQLKKHPELNKIYDVLSKNILKQNKK